MGGNWRTPKIKAIHLFEEAISGSGIQMARGGGYFSTAGDGSEIDELPSEMLEVAQAIR